MTRVSIVVPAYNHARFLAQAVESVLAQTYPAVELIVLDDGSTDGTRELLARYGTRFRWESQSNMGQAATLNRGWSMASGEILGYLSADDYLAPRAVERALAVLNAEPSSVAAYPDFQHVDERSAPLRVVRTPEFDYADMLLSGVCPPGPGALFRRSAYLSAGGWDESLHRIPDYDFWLRLGLVGPLRRIPEVLAYYRVHADAQSFSRVEHRRAEEFVLVVDRAVASPALPAALRGRAAQARANARLYTARLHMMSKRPGAAAGRILDALRHDPAAALRPLTYRLIASGVAWRLRIAEH